MKQWFLIESFKDGSEKVSPINGDGMPFVLKGKWMSLSDEEKKERSSYKAIFCEVYADGNPDLATIERKVEML